MPGSVRAAAAALQLVLGSWPCAAAAGGCELQGDSCICEDENGATYDVTALTAAANAGAPSMVIARGDCSGIFCRGTGFEYFAAFCGTLNPPTTCFSGQCCTTGDTLDLYRLDTRDDCPPSSLCQCDKLGDGSEVSVAAFDDGTDVGITLQYTNHPYYNTFAGWVPPIVNLICDPGASSEAYAASSSVTSNPSVVNAVGCTASYCSAEINWRTPVVCAGGGLGWTLVILILTAAGLYVASPLGYARFIKKEELSHGRPILETHPHYEAWRQLPALLEDGASPQPQLSPRDTNTYGCVYN